MLKVLFLQLGPLTVLLHIVLEVGEKTKLNVAVAALEGDAIVNLFEDPKKGDMTIA